MAKGGTNVTHGGIPRNGCLVRAADIMRAAGPAPGDDSLVLLHIAVAKDGAFDGSPSPSFGVEKPVQ